MTDSDVTNRSLAPLVDRLAAFLREQPEPPRSSLPDGPYGGDPNHVFESFGHHLVVLMLVARSDEDIVAAERQVVLRHCAERARKTGRELTSEEMEALTEYVGEYRPNQSHLDPALERLKRSTKDEIADLIEAAHAVVEADRVFRLQEALFLASLRRDLAAL